MGKLPHSQDRVKRTTVEKLYSEKHGGCTSQEVFFLSVCKSIWLLKAKSNFGNVWALYCVKKSLPSCPSDEIVCWMKDSLKACIITNNLFSQIFLRSEWTWGSSRQILILTQPMGPIWLSSCLKFLDFNVLQYFFFPCWGILQAFLETDQ